MMKQRGKETVSERNSGLVWLEDMRREDENEGFFRTAGKPLLLVICTVILAAALVAIGYSAFSYRSSRTEYSRLKELHVRTTSDPPAHNGLPDAAQKESGTKPAGAVLEIDFDALSEINADTVAWLDLPALNISYPVVYPSGEREYYLSHTFEGRRNDTGTLFVEPVNRPDFKDRNTFVYGHNATDGSMFGKLRELAYLDAEREANPFFFLYHKDGTVTKYRIYSCYVCAEDSDSFVTFDDAYYDDYVAMTKARSAVDMNTAPAGRGNLVTLSTCYGGPGTTKRFLVHGIETAE